MSVEFVKREVPDQRKQQQQQQSEMSTKYISLYFVPRFTKLLKLEENGENF